MTTKDEGEEGDEIGDSDEVWDDIGEKGGDELWGRDWEGQQGNNEAVKSPGGRGSIDRLGFVDEEEDEQAAKRRVDEAAEMGLGFWTRKKMNNFFFGRNWKRLGFS